MPSEWKYKRINVDNQHHANQRKPNKVRDMFFISATRVKYATCICILAPEVIDSSERDVAERNYNNYNCSLFL